MAALEVHDFRGLATALGTDEATVRNWHQRDRVPFTWLVEAARRKGLPLEAFTVEGGVNPNESRTYPPMESSEEEPLVEASQEQLLEVGSRIRAIRRDFGLTGGAMAMRLGISRGYFSELENGKRMPGRRVLSALGSEFGVSPAYLIDGLGARYLSDPDGEPLAVAQLRTVQRQQLERPNAPSTAHLDERAPPSNRSAPTDLPRVPPNAAEPAPPFFAREGLLVRSREPRRALGADRAAGEPDADVALAEHPERVVIEPHIHSPAEGEEAAAERAPLAFQARVPGSSSTVEYEVIPKHWGSFQPDEGDPRLGDVAFSVPFMRRRFGGRHGYEMLYMRGDSMEPTLSEEDEIIIDTNIRRVDVSGIYAISIGDAIMIQRVQRNLDGSLIVMSDNQRYKPTTLARSEVGTLQIVGRMVWPRVR